VGQRGHCNGRGLYFFIWKRKRKSSNGNRVFVHRRKVSTVERVELFSYRVSYIVLRGRWCNVSVLNVHSPSEEKSHDSRDSFCEELEQVFDNFS